MADGSAWLIRTKLYAPPLRAQAVARPRLLARLQAGLAGPLTLICAPAGYGKTSLMAAGAAAGSAPGSLRCAWLSLDEGDNDSGRFLAYLVAALQTAGAPAALGELLRGPQPTQLPVLLPQIINVLAAVNEEPVNEELLLVLDDYHVIHAAAVHAAVAALLEHAPPHLHLAILTRSDPPLPLPRLRARGQLLELRAADLRFTHAETRLFLHETMGLELADSLAVALAERTEGWIAGLQLAALRLAQQTPQQTTPTGEQADDAAAFVQHFAGTQRYILDYLLEEVLERQPPAVQQFLLLTSPLARLCGPLCDAVMRSAAQHDKRVAAAAGGENGGALLAALERANLFLTPLDDERRWYRYHQLFADLLRARLHEQFPHLASRLQTAAASWLEAEGLILEAVDQAMAAGEPEWAARLVEQNTAELLARGELAALLGWISALPDEVRRPRPRLCIQQAYALAFAGRLDEAAAALALAERVQTGDPAQTGAVTAVHAMLAVMRGRDAEAVTAAEQALALLPAASLWDRAAACWALGYAQRELGRLAEAQSCFEMQIDLARRLGNVWTLVTGLADLAFVLRTQGQLREARAVLEEALLAAAGQGAAGLGYLARMEAALAAVLYEQNEVAAAHKLLAAAVAHCRQWPNPNHIAFAYVLLARVQRAQGDLAGAAVSIGEAYYVRSSSSLTRVLRCLVEVELVRLYLACRTPAANGQMSGALTGAAEALLAQWRHESATAPGTALDECAELIALTLARAALAAGQPQQALPWVTRTGAGALAVGRMGIAIEALILTALAGKDSPAVEQAAWEQALQLAAERGYVRLFLDEGPTLQQSLAHHLAQIGDSAARPFALRLLAAFPAEPLSRAALPARPAPGAELPEPLTARELEVLHLLAQGLTNQEIARRLIVAPGTVKAHTAAIYRKLDAANRTSAVACARRLGIL